MRLDAAENPARHEAGRSRIPVLDTAITCEVTNGATAETCGIAAIFCCRSAGFHTAPSLRSMVTCGVNASSRARRSFSNPLITDNATDRANDAERDSGQRNDGDQRNESLAPARAQVSERNRHS